MGGKVEYNQNQSSSQTMKETSSASRVNQVPAGPTQESMRNPDGGSQMTGFGLYPGATYNEVWSWITQGEIDLNMLLQRCGMMGGKLQKIMVWYIRKLQ